MFTEFSGNVRRTLSFRAAKTVCLLLNVCLLAFASQIAQAATTVTQATGGGAILTTTAGGTYTTLTGPKLTETTTGSITAGTIILNAPSGFQFDTGGTAPTVLVDWISGGNGNANRNINNLADNTSAAITSRTTSTITFTVSAVTTNSALNSLTWQNVRVRPISGNPAASSGNITKTGTSTTVATNTILGALAEAYPVPTLTSLNPATRTAGTTGAYDVVITGSNFVLGASVAASGQGLVTTYDSSTQVTANIPASLGDTAPAGIYYFTVDNPTPGGGTSNQLAFTINNPVPVISAMNVTTKAVGSGNFVITVTGTKFMTGAYVVLNGVTLAASGTTTPTQIQATVPASAMTTAGTFNLTVNNVTPGGGASNALTFTVTNLVPTISNLSPNTALAGSALFVITVTGTNFVSNSQVYFNGTALTNTATPTATSISATVPANLIQNAGSYNVLVRNPTPGGGDSGTLPFTVTNNPLPTATSVTPNSAFVGATSFDITVTGTNFLSTSVVKFNGTALTTVGTPTSTSIKATVLASLVTNPGNYNVTVTNPSPGGGTSASLPFSVAYPVPAITSLVPNTKAVGSAQFNIQINGSSFLTNSTVSLNGTNLSIVGTPTATQITATVPVSLMTAAGTFNLIVTNPTPGGGPSSPQTFTVTNPAPTTSLLTPANTLVNSSSFTLTVAGTGFNSQSVVYFDGVAMATTGSTTPTQIQATIPNTALTTTGSYNVVVVNPAPGGGTSSPALPFQVRFPAPVISTLSTTSVEAGGTPFTLTAFGSNFASSATLMVNGVARSPVGTSTSTQVSATITAADIASTGTLSITVFNPTPGGGTTSALNLAVVATASKLLFSQQPSNAAGGASISPAVTVRVTNLNGVTVTGSSATVAMAIGTNAGAGTLSGTASVNAVNGVATFSNLSINNVGTGYTLTASSGALTAATSSAFNITVGAATKLVFVQQPTAAQIGVAISPAVTVQIQDAGGNLVNSTATVTIAIGTNPSAGTLSGTVSVAAVAGVATFSTLKINQSGTGYTLVATSGALTQATSSTFTILSATATKLAFSVQPTNTSPNNTITPAIKVEVRSAGDTLVNTATNLVTLSIANNPSAGGTGVISGTTSVNAVNGVATFSDIKISALGNGYTLGAATAGLTGATSDAFDVTTDVCYIEPFTNLNNWSVGNEGGAFGNPVATANGRMRMTSTASNTSTYATLQRLFPAAGNKVEVKFKYFSYGGSGADGIAVTLSDASAAPVSGAFGGSLGYAPKTIAGGGELNHPGFTGGWIGVALDEFGNFSSNTEGRSGGTAPGVRTNAVAIRGSGSGYSGYNYMAGTNTLSPVLTGTSTSGHAYRIIVDHTDGVHAYTSVERDTTGAGTTWSYLIPPFDAKASAAQAPVPASWFLSFTGSTGGSNNIHEIENLSVCSPIQQVLSLDHVRLEFPADAQTCGGGITPIIVKACANADCSVLYPGSVTTGLIASTGSLTSNSVTFTGGQTTVNFTKTTAGTVTFTGNVTAPSISTATCYRGSTEAACASSPMTVTVTSACYNAAEVNNSPGSRLLTKLAGVPFSVDVLAIKNGAVDATANKTISISLVNPLAATGNCNDTATGLTLPTTNYTFVPADAGRKTYTFTYPDAVRNIKVRIVEGSSSVCSSDDFTIRPQGFALTTNANGGLTSGGSTFKAGSAPFTVTATPVKLASTTVSGYGGNPRVDASKLKLSSTDTGSSGILVGALDTYPNPTVVPNPVTFQTTATGTFTYNQVGTLFFANLSVYDDQWVDHDISNNDCNDGFSNILQSGMYGCKFGNSSDILNGTITAGRFVPDHFKTTVTGPMVCNAATFTGGCPGTGLAYSGQPFTTTVTAYLANGAVATGYDGTYGALPVTLSTCATNGCTTTGTVAGAFTNSSVLASAFTSGTATVTTPVFSFPEAATFPITSPTVPTNLFIRAANTDSVTSLRTVATNSVEGGIKIVSGRVRLANAYGSDILDLPMLMRAEFWQANNQGWVTNIADATSAAALNYSVGITPCAIDPNGLSGKGCASSISTAGRLYNEGNAAGTTGFAGDFNLWWKGPGVSGTVLVTAAVDPWLQWYWSSKTVRGNPQAYATFGSTKPSRVIYRQEIVR